MRVAVCVRQPQEREALAKWIGQYCQLYALACDLVIIADPEEIFRAEQPFQLAFLGLGGQEGFLLIRRLRDADKRCRIVMIDDTAEFAVRGIRLQLSDSIVRPVDFKKVVRAMRLATTGGDL